MPSPRRLIASLAVLIGVVFYCYIGTILPRLATGLFASPDETAVSLFANAWTPSNGFRLPVAIKGESRNAAQLHPRSMVRQGDWLVPVGFLGMPFIVALADHVSQHAGEYLTLIFVLSATLPFFFLLKKHAGSFIAGSTIVIFLFFPTVLLYVNRGLFPNLITVACTLWAIWGLGGLSDASITKASSKERAGYALLSAFFAGLALLIRPTEAIWIIPWLGWAIWPLLRSNISWQGKAWSLFPFFAGLLAIGGIGIWLSLTTYPFHANLVKQPISGYQLSDYVPGQEQAISGTTEMRPVGSLVSIAFHPRTILTNIRLFGYNQFGVWIGVAILGALFIGLRWKRSSLGVFALSLWTFTSLLLLYGQTTYADNISGGATLGNSFLRYTLPAVPLIAIGCAAAADELRRISKRGLIFAMGLTLFFTMYGLAYALSGDSESILATRRELMRYTQIRSMAEKAIPTSAVIISERSDKIFASHASWTVVSPFPTTSTLTVLRDTEAPVYVFHRLIETDRDIPSSLAGVFPFTAYPLVVVDNEGLYPLYGISEQHP